MKVFLLWDHSEDGPETTFATTDQSLLAALVRKELGSNSEPALARLSEFLARPSFEGPNDRCSLQDGWGGWHVQVVELL